MIDWNKLEKQGNEIQQQHVKDKPHGKNTKLSFIRTPKEQNQLTFDWLNSILIKWNLHIFKYRYLKEWYVEHMDNWLCSVCFKCIQ